MSDDSINEQQVIDFLKQQPDFFVRNDELLSELKLPHASGGAVSLVERQVSTLRNKLNNCSHELASLIDIARENDSLNTRLHRMTVELFDASSLDDVIDSLQNHLRDQFNADAIEVKLFSSNELKKAADNGNSGPGLFLDLLNKGKPNCGTLEKPQLDYLFGEQNDDIGSVALVPLQGINITGMLVIGKHDPQHFHSGHGTDFLRRLGDIVVKAFESVELPA